MSNVSRESAFFSFMEENGPNSDGGKRNYISWLRYVSDEIGTVDETITAEKIDEIYLNLKTSKINRNKYTSDSSISDIKSALNKYLAFINQLSDYSKTTEDISSILNGDISTTKKQEIDARIGQGKYRKELIKIWEMCSLTKYQKIDFLVASHIKPWKESTDFEKTDPYNGLLLIPNIDKLFDSGYISFEDNGNIKISSLISKNDCKYMGISNDMKLFNVFKNNIPYLKYHRADIFIE